MLTNIMLVNYCKEVYRAGYVYWYGTVGYKCDKSLFNRKKQQYPSHYTSSRTSGYMKDISNGSWCADCVGMIKAFFWSNGKIKTEGKYKSNNCPDTSANGMIKLCVESGPIKTIPDIPGLVVWKDGHIGVYIGGGEVIEMNGFAKDCLWRKTSANNWTKWGKLPETMLQYVSGSTASKPTTTSKPATVELGDRTLRKDMEGADVKKLQTILLELFPGKVLKKYGADGDYGNETVSAVKTFQKKYGLTDDGIYGIKSHKMMLDVTGGDLIPDDEDVPEDGSAGADTRYVVIKNGNCNVRTGPAKTYSSVGTVDKGTKLVYAGETASNGWKKVYYKDYIGWCSGIYAFLEG